MMDERPPTIVSSNRFNDLEPYCSRVYHRKPDVWASTFPWEFPQNASKEAEEEFLNTYFSKDEIHMQGYRFLKQVFYCIALYNLNVRIPAFTDWWLAKPSSVEILSDTQLQPFLLHEKATTSTFFEDELPEYGEKFLKWVIPHLQNTIRQRLEAPKPGKKAVPAPIDSVNTSKKTSREVSGESEPKTAQSMASIVNTTVSLPSPANIIPLSAKDAPQSAPPFMTAMELAPRPRVVSDEKPLHVQLQAQSQTQLQVQAHRPEPRQQESQVQNRKRGNSFNKPYNQRGRGNYQNRNERNITMYPSSSYSGAPVPMRDHPRVTSVGPADFMGSIPQGQMMPPMPPLQRQYPPMALGHHMHQPPNMPPDPHFAPNYQPQYFNHPFGEPQNAHGFPTFEPQTQYFHDPQSFRGGHRRNSQGSRGKPFRGHNRGKNSRGRNSFSSHDHPLPAIQNENWNAMHPRDSISQTFASKQRRGSAHAIFEKNWRSGSEDPQVWSHDGAKENKPPQQQWAGYMPYTEPVHQLNLGYHDQHVSMIDPAKLEKKQKCSQHEIGPDCTYANKLIAINVPAELGDDEYLQFFNRLGQVQELNRANAGGWQDRRSSHCHLFITFRNAAEARKCLLEKPDRWLDGQPLKLEVPRQHWDEGHDKYIFQPGYHHHLYPKTREQPSATAVQVPLILRRSDEDAPSTREPSIATPEKKGTEDTSTDVTPTPSGHSTPKKNSKRGGNKSKNKKGKEDLRKASLKIDTDQMTKADDSNSETHDHVVPVSNSIDKQRSDSEQTEVRTMSEPTLFSPTDVVKTNLPVPDSAQTEVQTASSVGFNPAEDAQTELPSEPPPFHEKEKTATPEAKDMSEGRATIHRSDSDPVDESFHTATGSTEQLDEPDKLSTSAQSLGAANTAEGGTQERMGSPDSAVSPKTIKKVPVPQLPAMTRITSHSSSSTVRAEALEPPPPPSASAISPALPTPAFFTAPNTPAVPQTTIDQEESDIGPSANAQEEEPKPDPQPMKKPEKAKGPAQTESFSLFGKNKEKKPKGGKKGTLKCKPKMSSNAPSEVASDSMSRVVSAASTPIIEPVLDPKPGMDIQDDHHMPINDNPDIHATTVVKTDDQMTADAITEYHVPVNNKAEDIVPSNNRNGKRKHRSDSKAAQPSAKTSQDTERAIAEDLVAPPVPQQETPSKRKGFGSFFGLNIFTGTKSQDKSLEKDSKDMHESTGRLDGVLGQSKFNAFKSLTTSGDMIAKSTNQDASKDDAQGADAAKKKSNKNKMGRKKKKKAAANADEAEQQAEQQSSETPGSPTTFRFGKGDASPFRFDTTATETDHSQDLPTTPTATSAPAPVVDKQDAETEVGTALDAGSDATPHTDAVRDDTPSDDTIQSPTTPSGKKLPSKRSDSGHLLEAKTPNWKQHRKRVPSTTPRKTDTPTESEAGDGAGNDDCKETTPVFYLQCHDTKEATLTFDEIDEGEPKPPKKYYIYVGRGSREETSEADEVGMHTPDWKIRELAEKEMEKLREAKGKEKGENNSRMEDVTDE